MIIINFPNMSTESPQKIDHQLYISQISQQYDHIDIISSIVHPILKLAKKISPESPWRSLLFSLPPSPAAVPPVPRGHLPCISCVRWSRWSRRMCCWGLSWRPAGWRPCSWWKTWHQLVPTQPDFFGGWEFGCMMLDDVGCWWWWGGKG